jgi:putative ABC transport system permease protein
MRGKMNTIFTILAVAIGVSLVVSINVSAESMIYNTNDGLSQQLGFIDVILKEDHTSGSFNFQKMSPVLDTLDSIESYVPRLNIGSTIRLNSSSSVNSWGNIIGINASNPLETKFGKILINNTLPEYTNYKQIEEFLNIPGNSCVISLDLAQIYNLSVGDNIYIPALDMGIIGQIWGDTTTWSNYSIKAIIVDVGEATQDFAPPVVNSYQLSPPGRGIYVAMNDAYDNIFNTYGNLVSYIYIHASDINDINQTMEDVYFALENSPDFSGIGFYQANFKEEYEKSISSTINLLNLVFMILSFMGMLVCAILIKNLMEMSTQSQTYETGILRAIGAEKSKIYRIFFTQIIFISLIGSILGILLGIGLSFLFIDLISGLFFDTNFMFSFENLLIFSTNVYITGTPVIYGFISGMLIPILFGMLPVVKAVKIKIIEALQQGRLVSNLYSAKKAIQFLIRLGFSIGLTIVGYYSSNYGFAHLFTIYSGFAEIEGILFTLIGIFSLVIGLISLGTILLPFLSLCITSISIGILGNLRKITHRNVLRNSRQTNNTLAMLSIGFSLLVTISTILTSISAGAYPQLQTQFGGDIMVGAPWGAMLADVNLENNLSKIEYINNVCPIRVYGGKVDEFGEGINEDGLTEDLRIYVVNFTLYKELVMNSRMFQILTEPENANMNDILTEMEQGGNIILQYYLKEEIHKDLEENVTLKVSSFLKNLTLVAYAKALPGLGEMFWESSENSLRAVALVSAEDFPTLLTSGAFMITVQDIKQRTFIIGAIEDLYTNAGISWSSAYVIVAEDYMETGVIVQMFQSIIQSILSFALIVSLLGLIISMVISVNKRKTEIGIMRAIGSTRSQIIRMIFGETLVISTTGIAIGILTGILTATLMLVNIGFMTFLPIIFTIPIDFILSISSILILVAISTSIIPAYSAMRINIIDSIRSTA